MARQWFGLSTMLFVAGCLTMAWVVFTPGRQEWIVPIVAGIGISAGAQGMYSGFCAALSRRT